MALKVAQILYSGLGGHGSVAFSLLRASKASEVWEGCLIFVGIEPVLPAYEVQCRELNVARAGIQTEAGRAWKSWPHVFKSLRRCRPDAIVLHSVKMIVPCWWYSVLHRVPLIAVEHQSNALKSGAEWVVSHLLMILADAVVTLTEGYRSDLQRRLGPFFRPSRTHLISTGIDVSLFSPKRPPAARAGSTILVGMAARFTPIKKHALLVNAIGLLRSATGHDWKLSLAGDGETREVLQKQVDDAGLHDAVTFTGFLNEAQLAQWFGKLQIYAHASEGETLSTSLLQAMAMELPIVASDVAGIDNLLGSNNEYGLLASNADAESFARKLRQVAEAPAAASAMARRARLHAEQNFSQEAMFGMFNRLLARLC